MNDYDKLNNRISIRLYPKENIVINKVIEQQQDKYPTKSSYLRSAIALLTRIYILGCYDEVIKICRKHQIRQGKEQQIKRSRRL
jgi:hypothetical protein